MSSGTMVSESTLRWKESGNCPKDCGLPMLHWMISSNGTDAGSELSCACYWWCRRPVGACVIGARVKLSWWNRTH